MICIVQRVLEASVIVDGNVVGKIGPGLCVLLAVHATDTDADVAWTAAKLTSLRIFRKDDKHFDIDVKEAGGAILLVSNFTVAGATQKGRRPSFDKAAGGERGKSLFDAVAAAIRAQAIPVSTGVFGADMRVTLTNDGPATFIVEGPSK